MAAWQKAKAQATFMQKGKFKDDAVVSLLDHLLDYFGMFMWT